MVIVNAVTGSQQELVKALKENGRELQAVQTLANVQKSMGQCLESFKRELSGLSCKRETEDISDSRSTDAATAKRERGFSPRTLKCQDVLRSSVKLS